MLQKHSKEESVGFVQAVHKQIRKVTDESHSLDIKYQHFKILKIFADCFSLNELID